MSKVYSNCLLTIGAACAISSFSGLFNPRYSMVTVVPIAKVYPEGQAVDEARTLCVVDPWMWREEVEESVWGCRAWVLQERLLSKRVLICGTNQLLWQCRQGPACETFPKRLPAFYFSRYETLVLGQTPPSSTPRINARLGDFLNLLEAWGTVCETYSKAELTYVKDRIIAFAGAAEYFAKSIKARYVVGLWLDRCIELQLLWQTVDPLATERILALRASSWSWLSVEGAREFLKCIGYKRCMARVTEVRMPTMDEAFYGANTRVRLVMHALVLEGELEGLDKEKTKDIPEETHYSTHHRANFESSQRFRFTASRGDFTLHDAHGIWFHFDEALLLKKTVKCYGMPILVIPDVVDYHWCLYGLVVADAGVKPHVPPYLTRVGTFNAKREAACKVTRHSTCKGLGCDLENMRLEDEAQSHQGGLGRRPAFRKACTDFFDESLWDEVILI